MPSPTFLRHTALTAGTCRFVPVQTPNRHAAQREGDLTATQAEQWEFLGCRQLLVLIGHALQITIYSSANEVWKSTKQIMNISNSVHRSALEVCFIVCRYKRAGTQQLQGGGGCRDRYLEYVNKTLHPSLFLSNYSFSFQLNSHCKQTPTKLLSWRNPCRKSPTTHCSGHQAFGMTHRDCKYYGSHGNQAEAAVIQRNQPLEWFQL